MAIKKWSEWLDDVMPSVPGCTNAIAEYAIRQAAIDFCRRSRVVQVELDDQTTEANVDLYDVSADSYTDVVRIETASLDGEEMSPPFRFYSFDSDGQQIKLFTVPDGAYTLSVTVSTTPKATATGVDSSVFTIFREAIASGALQRLMMMPRKPWTAPELAGYHRDAFETGIRAAEAKRIKDGVTGLMRTTSVSMA